MQGLRGRGLRRPIVVAITLARRMAAALRMAAGRAMLAGDTAMRRLARAAGVAGAATRPDLPPTCPAIDPAAADPVAAVLASPDFAACAGFFAALPAFRRALVSAETQALLYALVRHLRPEAVVEIGTYRASTTEAVCRALCANGGGTIHTVDPFRHRELSHILRGLPLELRDRLRFHGTDSMRFFAAAMQDGLRAGLVFVDGNHDYEFARFDIECAARLLQPGGFLAIDNISQAGPYFAARDFLRDHPGWQECAAIGERFRAGLAFDRDRTTIADTDLCVIRAPRHRLIGARPTTLGEAAWRAPAVVGVALSIARPATGTLYAQAVVRVFGQPPTERTVEGALPCRATAGPVELPLAWQFAPGDLDSRRGVELWLSWQGDEPLALDAEPRLF